MVTGNERLGSRSRRGAGRHISRIHRSNWLMCALVRRSRVRIGKLNILYEQQQQQFVGDAAAPFACDIHGRNRLNDIQGEAACVQGCHAEGRGGAELHRRGAGAAGSRAIISAEWHAQTEAGLLRERSRDRREFGHAERDVVSRTNNIGEEYVIVNIADCGIVSHGVVMEPRRQRRNHRRAADEHQQRWYCQR